MELSEFVGGDEIAGGRHVYSKLHLYLHLRPILYCFYFFSYSFSNCNALFLATGAGWYGMVSTILARQ